MKLAIAASHPIQYQAPLFRELARRLELHVFFAHRASPDDQARAGFGIPFAWDCDLLSGYRSTFLQNVSARPGTDRFTGCDTPDIPARLKASGCRALLVLGWHLKSYLQAAWAAKRLGLPVLVRGDSQLATPRSAVWRAAKEALYPLGLRAFDAALYVGQNSRAYYEHYGTPRQKLFFSPHCTDTEWFAARATEAAGAEVRLRLGIPQDSPVVLFAGKLMALKRPLDILEALAHGGNGGRKVHVLVAGAGELEAAMCQRAGELGLPLHMAGFQNQSRMPAIYAAASVLALPSAGETWGLVVNEALACGVPAVVSDGAGCALDLVADGQAGRMFPAGGIRALAAALRGVLANPPSREAIRRRSDAYSVAAAADGIVTALAAVTGKRPNPRGTPQALQIPDAGR